SGSEQLFNLNGTLIMAAPFMGAGAELWKSDGTDVGTVPLRNINPGAAGSNPNNFTIVGSNLYFTADDTTHGRELWVTDGIDGTDAHTHLVADINPILTGSARGSDPSSLVNVNGTLYFAASDGTGDAFHGSELWRSDGTDFGTTMVADIVAG